MSKIIIGKADGKQIEFDLKTLIQTRLLIQANSGGGKSWLLRVIAEQAFGKVQTIILDREGEFSTLREKFDYVLAGKGGETPTDVRSAHLLAMRLLELNASAVCDLYDMKNADRHRWVRIFLETIVDAPKKFWRPLLVVVDESHLFAPEKGSGESEASDAMIALATQGRKRGYCAVFATQRLGKLRKDAAAELLNILVGQTFIDIDRKRAAEALGIPKSEERVFFEETKLMEAGQFFAFGRAITKERQLVTIGKVQTTHAEAGSYRHATAAPPTPAKIKAMLPKLADLPQEAEAKAKTEAELRTEIRTLQTQLKQQPKPEIKNVVMGGPVQKPITHEDLNEILLPIAIDYNKVVMDRVEELRKSMSTLFHDVFKKPFVVKDWKERLVRGAARLNGSKIPSGEFKKGESSRAVPAETRKFTVVPQKQTPRLEQHRALPGGKETGDGEVKLGAGARRLLSALVSWSPNGMKEGQWRSHAGLRKSGTFSTYKSALRSAGFITEDADRKFYATQEGITYMGDKVEQAPTTTDEVLALWKPKLGAGARRILDALVEAGGETLTQEELTEKTGLQKSGTFSTYISALRTAQLVLTKDGRYYANRETLFL
jgi:hypothetical protein